ncbi:hypothetical protein DM02DRAFT_623579 [Periconia macrospinosa]|uniref:Uncharacterized protein n=1 Tax=Periconia macrospinosa TaxID=97972 RepID=A0A2V1E8B2_9PLEO|nr:hypothetical protein DM02DRAFT_623579 [Periconia macrospinosa]
MISRQNSTARRQYTSFDPITEEESTPASNPIPQPTPSPMSSIHHQQQQDQVQTQQPPPMNPALQKALDKAAASISASIDPARSPFTELHSLPLTRSAGKMPVRSNSTNSPHNTAAMKRGTLRRTPSSASVRTTVVANPSPNVPIITVAAPSPTPPVSPDSAKQEMKYEAQSANTLDANEEKAPESNVEEMKYKAQPANTLDATEEKVPKSNVEEKKKSSDDEQKSKNCMTPVVGAFKRCFG